MAKKNYGILGAISVCLMIVAFAQVPATAEELNHSRSSMIAGEGNGLGYELDLIVDGVVFRKGPVAQKLGITVDYPSTLTVEERAMADQVQDKLGKAMITADGQKLRHAIPALTSGNPYIVEEGLQVFAESFRAALDQEYPGVSDIPVRAPSCGIVAVCGAVSVAAIALGAAIAVVVFNVAGGVNMIYNQNGLWNQNGVWNGKKAPVASNPTELIENYPSLSASDEIRRITQAARL